MQSAQVQDLTVDSHVSLVTNKMLTLSKIDSTSQ